CLVEQVERKPAVLAFVKVDPTVTQARALFRIKPRVWEGQQFHAGGHGEIRDVIVSPNRVTPIRFRFHFAHCFAPDLFSAGPATRRFTTPPDQRDTSNPRFIFHNRSNVSQPQISYHGKQHRDFVCELARLESSLWRDVRMLNTSSSGER